MAEPKIVFDADYLTMQEIELGDEPIPLCLSPIVFSMLANMNQMVLWPTRWKGSQSNIYRLMWQAWEQLNIPDICPDICPDPPDPPEPEACPPDQQNYINYLLLKIKELERCVTELECEIMSGCCCNGQNNNSPSEVFNPRTYSDLIDDLIQILCSGDAPADDSKCKKANFIFDSWLDFLSELSILSGQGALTPDAIVGLIFSAPWALGTKVTAVAIVAMLTNYIESVTTGAVQSFLEAKREQIINLMYSAQSPQQAQSDVLNYVQRKTSNLAVRSIFWAIAQIGDWNALFNDDMAIPADYSPPTPCTVDEPVDPDGYTLVPLPAVAGGVTNGMVITVDSVNDHIVDFSWDNTSNPYGPAGTVTVTWPSGSVGILVQFITFTSDANLASAKIDFDSSTSVPSLDIDFYGLNTPFEHRGRTSTETGLVDWVAEVATQLQDNVSRQFRNNLKFALANVSGQITIGQCVVRLFAVVPL